MAPPFPRFFRIVSRFRKRRAPRVARARLLRAGTKPSGHRKGRCRSISRTLFAINQSVPIVEANTARVLTRLFDFRRSIESLAGRKTLWEYAASLVPKSNAGIYNSALIDLGALVCVPREPKCGICPVKRICRGKNPESLPIKKGRPRTERVTENHAFIVRPGKILLEQSAARWRGMWILPPL